MPRQSKANKVRNYMNPLRRLTLESRSQRKHLEAKRKPAAKRQYVLGPKPAWHNHRVPLAKTGIRLVVDPNKVQKLTRGDYVAEITVNRKSAPVLFHYVLTKKDSPEILAWGQTVSIHAALTKARMALQRLAAEDCAPGRLIAAD